MPNKFRKERYIIQKCYKNKWSFRVRYGSFDMTFNEKDYLSASQAFKEAVDYRNKIIVTPITISNKKVEEIYNEIDDVYVLRSETKRKLDVFFKKYIKKKDVAISKINRADILSDLNSMVDSCSSDTIKRVFSIWRKIYGVAIAKNYVDKDMTLNIKCPPSHKVKKQPRNELIELSDLEKLAAHLEKTLDNDYERKQAPYILYVLYYTGLRPAELFALNKTDIDLKNKIIKVTKELGSDRDKIAIRNCKTEESHRNVPISHKCLKYLKEALKLAQTGILFSNSKGTHHNITNLGYKYHRLAKQLNIDFHFYQCRHTFITILFMKGIDLKTIQKIVGQRIDSTTIGYVITNEEKIKNAIELI